MGLTSISINYSKEFVLFSFVQFLKSVWNTSFNSRWFGWLWKCTVNRLNPSWSWFTSSDLFGLEIVPRISIASLPWVLVNNECFCSPPHNGNHLAFLQLSIAGHRGFYQIWGIFSLAEAFLVLLYQSECHCRETPLQRVEMRIPSSSCLQSSGQGEENTAREVELPRNKHSGKWSPC